MGKNVPKTYDGAQYKKLTPPYKHTPYLPEVPKVAGDD